MVGADSDSDDDDDDDDDDTMGLHADSGEGNTGVKADAGTILEIAGDASGGDEKTDAGEDERIRIEGDACRDGGDGDGGEDGRMGVEADPGAVSDFEGELGGAGEVAAPAAAIGSGPYGDIVFLGPGKKRRSTDVAPKLGYHVYYGEGVMDGDMT